MFIQIKGGFGRRLPLRRWGASRWLPRRIQEFETDPVEPVLASAPGFVGRAACPAGTALGKVKEGPMMGVPGDQSMHGSLCGR